MLCLRLLALQVVSLLTPCLLLRSGDWKWRQRWEREKSSLNSASRTGALLGEWWEARLGFLCAAAGLESIPRLIVLGECSEIRIFRRFRLLFRFATDKVCSFLVIVCLLVEGFSFLCFFCA